FGSAAAIYLSLHAKCTVTIGIPEHINSQAKALAGKLPVPYVLNPSLKGFDCLLCLDFNEPEMLGALGAEFLSFRGEKYHIDHHSVQRDGAKKPRAHLIAPPQNSLISPKAISTTELVYALLKASKIKIPQKALACIACGIITD